MEDIDKDFIIKVNDGDIIVAGKNFGCGSSREHAPLAIKTAGISCIIVETGIGGPKWDSLPGNLRHEIGLLGIRKELQVKVNKTKTTKIYIYIF